MVLDLHIHVHTSSTRIMIDREKIVKIFKYLKNVIKTEKDFERMKKVVDADLEGVAI